MIMIVTMSVIGMIMPFGVIMSLVIAVSGVRCVCHWMGPVWFVDFNS